MAAQDIYTRQWITENAIEVCETYEPKELTIRALYYRLVARGMTNSQRHYKRVVSAMDVARWEGWIPMGFFVDRDRSTEGRTENMRVSLDESVGMAKRQLRAWMNNYSLERWSNQSQYVEVLIEKKALQSVFEKPCAAMDVALSACKGYPSLTFLHDLKERINEAAEHGQDVTILYFGDYDPSGEDIPRSIEDNLRRMGAYGFTLDRRALMEYQVVEWNLPPAPAKLTDSRTANWDGLGQVELDAVEPHELQRMCEAAIMEYYSEEAHGELVYREALELGQYRAQLREYVENEL